MVIIVLEKFGCINKRHGRKDRENEMGKYQQECDYQQIIVQLTAENEKLKADIVKRDAAEAALKVLRVLAQASLDARDKEAKAAMSLENAQANFHRFDAEECAHEQAMIEASEADRALREALATPNEQS